LYDRIMSGHDDQLWFAAERFYDGPIPLPLRAALRRGGARAAEREQARSEAAFFTRLVATQLTALRARAPRAPQRLLDDLALYRTERRRWRSLAKSLS
jgi:hypothetical protein